MSGTSRGAISLPVFKAIQHAAEHVTDAIAPRVPEIGVVLGSGLGRFAETLDNPCVVPYETIPGFVPSQVRGHAGRLVLGKIQSVEVLAMQGRVHMYEGHPLSTVVLPVRTLVHCGCRVIIITNAAGGIRKTLSPGNIVLISDHINLTGRNPLEGENDELLGTRFPDMSNAYNRRLRQIAHRTAAELNIALEEGVYGWMSGPSYETPAEIRMLDRLGADLAGMSTVPEVIASVHMGARVLGISCVTNMAAGLGGALSHDEVKATAQRVEDVFVTLLRALVLAITEES